MNKKKVVYILHDMAIGGVEVALLSAIPTLNSKFNLKVICFGRVDDNLIRHLSPQDRNAIISFKYSLLSFPFGLFRIVKYILSLRPDVVICSLWRASIIGVIVKALRSRTRFISFIHSTKFFHSLDAAFSKLAINSADEILTDSKATSNALTPHLRTSAPVRVVSYFTVPSPSSKRNALLYPQKEISFLYLGRINKVKNIPLSIDVISYLRSYHINASLDLYGKDDGLLTELNEYIELQNMTDYVHYKGELNPSSKSDIFSNYNFLIQLSEAEGMAMSVAEAMQYGVVPVVTPVGEIPNYSKDMESAVFVDIWDSTGWLQSLAKVKMVTSNIDIYNSMSDCCFTSMQGVKTYTESLVHYISNDSHL